MRKTSIVFLSFFLLAYEDEKPKGIIETMKEAYHEGRYEANERRIVKRKRREKISRRRFFRKNVNKIISGIEVRLKRKPSRIDLVLYGGAGLAIFLCYKGSIGCSRKDDDRNPR